MVTLAICDDDAYFLECLQKSVRRYLASRGLDARIMRFLTGEELLSAESAADIVLLDLKLPGKSGLEIARQLHRETKESRIIFITSYQEYALQAFDLDAVHYLVKPVCEKKIFHALDKALDWVTPPDREMLILTKGSGAQRVPMRDILYCEVIDHKVYIHTLGASYDYFGTLQALQEKLSGLFFRCHKSYIVNLNFVVCMGRDTATVTGGGQVLISRRKRQAFTKKLLELFRSEALE